MKQIILLSSLLWIIGHSLCGQVNSTSSIAPQTLIPYNDHGKWGYCDTLGNLQITPAYGSARFFASHKLGTGREWLGEVQTKWGNNLLTTTGELLLPKKLDVVMPIYEEDGPENLFLVRKRGKYGIYALDAEKLIVKTVYDSLLWRKGMSVEVLLKRDKEATYEAFDREQLQMIATEVVSTNWYWMGQRYGELRKWQDGTYRKWQEEQWQIVGTDAIAEYVPLDQIREDQSIDEEYNMYYWLKDKPRAEEMKVDQILEYRDYSNSSFASKYGFTKLMIVKKDGKTGIINNKGEVLLPIIYDKVTLDERSRAARLEKDGKLGHKLLFTHYPTIEARYDEIKPVRKIRVNHRWSFALFEVEVGGEKGYVGENAVEYFDFE